MAFDFSAFFGGFAKAAGDEVEKRNKEIRDTAITEFEQLRKKAEEQNEKLRTQRDKLKSTAEVLSSYRGSNNQGFTEQQIVGLLQNPAVAKRVQETLDKNADDLDQIDFNKLFTISRGQSDQTVDSYIQSRTAAPKPTEQDAQRKEVRTAFGLKSPALQRAEAEFSAAAGKPVAQLRAEARGVSEETTKAEGVLDLSQFKSPENIARIQARLRDNIANGDTDLNSEKNKPLVSKLQANVVIEKAFEGDKARTSSEIRSVIKDSVRAGMDPFIVKGVAKIDPNSSEVVPITGDATAVKEFLSARNKVIENNVRAMGLVDKDNNIIGGRSTFDALIPYANIKNGKIVSWKDGTEGEAPKDGQPAAPAAAPKVNPNPVPIPKTANGEIDGTKLLPGQKYVSGDVIKIWNGMSWQELNKK